MTQEIFTVGEEIATNEGRGRHKILGFKIIDSDMCVELEGFKTQYEFLSKIQKLPSPSTKDDNTFQVDNGNSKTNVPDGLCDPGEYYYKPKYSESQMDIAIEQTWKAARETVDGFAWDQFRPLKWKSLEEFLNNKK